MARQVLLFKDQVDRFSVLNPFEAWWQKETHINWANRFQHWNVYHQVNVHFHLCFFKGRYFVAGK